MFTMTIAKIEAALARHNSATEKLTNALNTLRTAEELVEGLNGELQGHTPAVGHARPTERPSKHTPESKALISAAQQKRWAKWRRIQRDAGNLPVRGRAR